MVLLLWRLYPSISVTDQASACGVSRKTPVHRNHAEANKSSAFAPAAAHHTDIFRQQFSEQYKEWELLAQRMLKNLHAQDLVFGLSDELTEDIF